MKHYIDADLAIRNIEELADDARERDIEPEFSAGWVIEFLANFPQAADAPKQGKWAKIGEIQPIYVCNVCMKRSDSNYSYCPHCGTYMGVCEK